MSNMSYCRFTNTRSDMDDCLNALCRDERLSATEARAGRNMFKEFLTFCRDQDIISDYDGEVLDSLFRNLKERNCDVE